MFGTVGHFQCKPGHEGAIEELVQEWSTTIRPRIPGLVIVFAGAVTGEDHTVVNVVLMQDEETYRNLANLPEQDAWYRRLVAHLEREPSWEDCTWTSLRMDAFLGNGLPS